MKRVDGECLANTQAEPGHVRQNNFLKIGLWFFKTTAEGNEFSDVCVKAIRHKV